MACIWPGLGPEGEVDEGSWTARIPMEPPGGHWAVRNCRTRLRGVGKGSPWGRQGNQQGRAHGSSGLMEVKDDRYSLLDTADAAGCRGRAENSVWAHRQALAWGQREKGRRRALAGSHRDEDLLACLGGLFGGRLGLVAAMVGNTGRPNRGD